MSVHQGIQQSACPEIPKRGWMLVHFMGPGKGPSSDPNKLEYIGGLFQAGKGLPAQWCQTVGKCQCTLLVPGRALPVTPSTEHWDSGNTHPVTPISQWASLHIMGPRKDLLRDDNQLGSIDVLHRAVESPFQRPPPSQGDPLLDRQPLTTQKSTGTLHLSVLEEYTKMTKQKAKM